MLTPRLTLPDTLIIPAEVAHAQPENDLLNNRIQKHFEDFDFVQHALAVKIDYGFNNVDPLSPAQRAQQQVRVWHFIRNPAGPPAAIPAPPPPGLPPYPWEIGALWAAPTPGQRVISLPTSSLADPATAPLPAAAINQNFTLDMFEVYQYLREEGYLLMIV